MGAGLADFPCPRRRRGAADVSAVILPLSADTKGFFEEYVYSAKAAIGRYEDFTAVVEQVALSKRIQ